MIIRVHYHESVKDADGGIHTYKAEVEKELPEEGLNSEQIVVKMRANIRFLHREIHYAIQQQQVEDGLIDTVTHKPGAKIKG